MTFILHNFCNYVDDVLAKSRPAFHRPSSNRTLAGLPLPYCRPGRDRSASCRAAVGDHTNRPATDKTVTGPGEMSTICGQAQAAITRSADGVCLQRLPQSAWR